MSLMHNCTYDTNGLDFLIDGKYDQKDRISSFTLTSDLAVSSVCKTETDLWKCGHQLLLSLRSTTTGTALVLLLPSYPTLDLYTTQLGQILGTSRSSI